METMSELIEEFKDQHNINSLEGSRGLHHLNKICKAIGYKDLISFLYDNPGAIESLVDWIADSDVDSWKESIETHLT